MENKNTNRKTLKENKIYHNEDVKNWTTSYLLIAIFIIVFILFVIVV